MKRFLTLLLMCAMCYTASAQTPTTANISLKDSLIRAKDSTYKAMFRADSIKIEKDFAQQEKFKTIGSKLTYPLLKGGMFSGVIPVSDPTEKPDPTIDYKILFEMTEASPDSGISQINPSLDEVARVINLHVAAGIPAKKIIPAVVVHAGALFSLMTNEAYHKKFNTDNPNIQLLNDMLNIGTKFIACGQAMNFLGINKDQLLPFVKVSLTAQTVISSYQLKGYVLHPIKIE